MLQCRDVLLAMGVLSVWPVPPMHEESTFQPPTSLGNCCVVCARAHHPLAAAAGITWRDTGTPRRTVPASDRQQIEGRRFDSYSRHMLPKVYPLG